MFTSRRMFLSTLAAATLTSSLPTITFARNGGSKWMACRKVGNTFRATLFNGNGAILMDVPLPARGHGLATSSARDHLVIFARRPGTFAIIVELTSHTIVQEITASAGRHFYGHGCFSQDGKFLYTTENDLESGNGVIGVRDVENGYALVASHASGGIGPHELALMPDGKTLAIANGGILTNPELERAKLNLDTMAPSLVLMNRINGHIASMHKLAPELHQLSVRHMSIAPTGAIVLALQYEGPKSHRMSLLATFEGNGLTLADAPETLTRAMRNYAGSIVHDPSGQIIGMTSPRGNLVSFWDANSHTLLGQQTMRDVCGIAPGDMPGEFILAGGSETMNATPLSLSPSGTFADTQWDNHMVPVA